MISPRGPEIIKRSIFRESLQLLDKIVLQEKLEKKDKEQKIEMLNSARVSARSQQTLNSKLDKSVKKRRGSTENRGSFADSLVSITQKKKKVQRNRSSSLSVNLKPPAIQEFSFPSSDI